MLRYRRDKAGFLQAIALQHLGAIRRRVLRIECKLECQRREMRDMAVISNPFVGELIQPRQEADEQDVRVKDKLRAKRLKHTHGAKVDVRALRDVFESVDQSREGLLNKVEFANLFRDLHGAKPGPEFEKIWRKADTDGSGSIDFDEYLDIMVRLGWYKLLGSQGALQTGTEMLREQISALKDRHQVTEDAKYEQLVERVSERVGAGLQQASEQAAEAAARLVTDIVAEYVGKASAEAATKATDSLAPA
eukprot:SRR837773.1624.p2 GENE.SRR837773.1624~~SRR837773.1624.p2  ORF type:complete len:249 (+),score=86.77 SRR837773.1624:167-913(+)